MRDIKELCNIVEEELGKIAEKGLTSGNLDTAYKLIDIYKDIKNTEYWDKKCEHYDEMGGSEYSQRGYSTRGRYSRTDGSSYGHGSYNMGSSNANRGQHYVHGHYSRTSSDPYSDYMDEKQSYRSSGKNEDCKQRMINALEEHLDELTDELKTMSNDADCAEERQMIGRYIQKLQKIV